MLDWAVEQTQYPVAIRVPVNGVISKGNTVRADYSKLNQYEVEKQGKDVAVIALGDFYQIGEQVAEKLEATLINPLYITGVDTELLESLKENHHTVITLEDGILDGGFGEKITRFYGDSDMKVLNYGLKKEFLDRYHAGEIMKENHLTPEQIIEDIKKKRNV